MPEKILDDAYWNERWLHHDTSWDVGEPAGPLKAYTDHISGKLNTTKSILIPGCGNAYEAAYLLQKGFTNITLIDISEALAEKLRQRFAGSSVHVILGDFFEHAGSYDLILEQTFFCALNPALRPAYVKHMHHLLKPGGRIAGVMFNTAFEAGPPFGGTANEYRPLFTPLFNILKMEPCYNSISRRAGSEIFVEMERKEI